MTMRPKPRCGQAVAAASEASTRDWMAWASAEDPPRTSRAPDAPTGTAPVLPVAVPPDAVMPGGHGPDPIPDAATAPARRPVDASPR